jgi:hypothetical protein
MEKPRPPGFGKLDPIPLCAELEGFLVAVTFNSVTSIGWDKETTALNHLIDTGKGRTHLPAGKLSVIRPFLSRIANYTSSVATIISLSDHDC